MKLPYEAWKRMTEDHDCFFVQMEIWHRRALTSEKLGLDGDCDELAHEGKG